jgi:hypothetical protein
VALWAGALLWKKKKSQEQKSSFRIRRTTVLGMFNDSAVILDATRLSFFNKSAAIATMFTSFKSSHPVLYVTIRRNKTPSNNNLLNRQRHVSTQLRGHHQAK